jgi:dTDP-4-dehydrorhamnose reductase
MRRILITGASGDLGRPLSALAKQGWDVTSTYFTRRQVGGGTPVQIDLRDRAAVLDLIRRVRPDVIIHTAGSERSTDMVTTIAAAAWNVLEAAVISGSRLIALSTDMVYDGTQAPYAEDDPPTPLSTYGKVKAQMEQMFLRGGVDCLVVRTSLIYDLDPANRQIAWMHETIKQGKPVTLFTDEVRQPIWAWNLAKALLELATAPAVGLLNVAGPVPLTRWEYGCALLRATGYSPLEVAVPVQAAVVAPGRPRNCTLRLEQAEKTLKTRLLPLDEVLQSAAD